MMQHSSMPVLGWTTTCLTVLFIVSLDVGHAAECTLHPKIHARILKDLQPWKHGITEDLMHDVNKLCPEDDLDGCGMRYIRVLIEDGQVYLNSLLLRPKVDAGLTIPGSLLDLLDAAHIHRLAHTCCRLPDVEFIMSSQDEPQMWAAAGVKADFLSEHPPGMIPTLYLSKYVDLHQALLMPMSSHFRCHSDGTDHLFKYMGQFDSVPWSARKRVAFTRFTPFCAHWHRLETYKLKDGSPIPCPRKHLMDLSLKHPDLLDIKSGESAADYVPLFKHNQYAYLVYTDGWTAASKMDKYMVIGSPILRQESKSWLYYYDALEPWVHYVPFFTDNATDILQAVQWALTHDNEMWNISRNAREFALQYLSKESRMCYWKTLLEELAKLFKYKPSCRKRTMCVPLVEELKWMHKHAHPGCNVPEQLEGITGQLYDPEYAPTKLQPGVAAGTRFTDRDSGWYAHGYDHFWPHEKPLSSLTSQ